MQVIPGYPSLSDEARGVLKFLWRKSHVKDDWTKGGEISDAWDRWSIFPWYMYPRYDLEWSTRVSLSGNGPQSIEYGECVWASRLLARRVEGPSCRS